MANSFIFDGKNWEIGIDQLVSHRANNHFWEPISQRNIPQPQAALHIDLASSGVSQRRCPMWKQLWRLHQ